MTLTAVTVSTTVAYFEYALNGVTAGFPVPFQFFAQEDLFVTWGPVGTENSLGLGLDYTVATRPTDLPATGTLTLLNPASFTGIMRITRLTPRTQSLDLQTTGTISPEALEDAYDRAILIDQEQDAGVLAATDFIHGNLGGGSLHTAATETVAGFESAADKTNLDRLVSQIDLFVSTGDTNVYVDSSTGNDANNGTSGAPLLTITEAVNRIPKFLHHLFTVHLSGSFTESVTVNPTLGTKAALVTFQGAMTTASGLSAGCPTTGIFGAPTTSNARETASRWLPITTGTPAMVTNELVGYFAQVNSVSYPIIGNDATNVELASAGSATACSGGVFTIVKPGVTWAGNNSPALAITGGRATSTKLIEGAGGVGVNYIDFKASGSSYYGVSIIGGTAGAYFNNCRFDISTGSGLGGMRIDGGGGASISYSSFIGPVTISTLGLVGNCANVLNLDDVLFHQFGQGLQLNAVAAGRLNGLVTGATGVVVQNSTLNSNSNSSGFIFRTGEVNHNGDLIVRNNLGSGFILVGPCMFGSAVGNLEFYGNGQGGIHFNINANSGEGGGRFYSTGSVYIGENTGDGLTFGGSHCDVNLSNGGALTFLIKNNTGFGVNMRGYNGIGQGNHLGGLNRVCLAANSSTLASNSAGDITYDGGSTIKSFSQYTSDHPTGAYMDPNYGNVFVIFTP